MTLLQKKNMTRGRGTFSVDSAQAKGLFASAMCFQLIGSGGFYLLFGSLVPFTVKVAGPSPRSNEDLGLECAPRVTALTS